MSSSSLRSKKDWYSSIEVPGRQSALAADKKMCVLERMQMSGNVTFDKGRYNGGSEEMTYSEAW